MIVSITAVQRIVDCESKEVESREVTLGHDECNRPSTPLDGPASLRPVVEGGTVTAGNASQLFDGAPRAS